MSVQECALYGDLVLWLRDRAAELLAEAKADSTVEAETARLDELIRSWFFTPQEELYGFEVFTPPSTYPFHELDNVVMSPHQAGGSGETEMRRMTHLAALLNAAARGDEMPNRVDLRAGY
jgi:hypothetical protein